VNSFKATKCLDINGLDSTEYTVKNVYNNCISGNGSIITTCYESSSVPGLNYAKPAASMTWTPYSTTPLYDTGQSLVTWSTSLNQWAAHTTNATEMRWTGFGYAVALSSDGKYLAVGIPGTLFSFRFLYYISFFLSLSVL